jgi:uncharacterized protein (TIGR01777 family)
LLDNLPGNVRLAPYSALPDSADAVINLAGETIAGRWTKEKMRRILGSRVDITRLLVEWMTDLKEKPIVFLSGSAVGYYGDRGDEPITGLEGPDQTHSFLSIVCMNWEGEANKASSAGIRVVNLRIGHVLDPSGGVLGEMASKFKRAPFIVPHATSACLPWIARQDLIKSIEFCMEQEAVSGPVNLVAPATATWAEFYECLGTALEKRVVGRLPYWMLRLAVGRFAESLVISQRIVPKKLSDSGYSFGSSDLADYFKGLRAT